MEDENTDNIALKEETILNPKREKGRPRRTKNEEEIKDEMEEQLVKQQISDAKHKQLEEKREKRELKKEALERGEIYIDPEKPPRKPRGPASEKQLENLAKGRALGRERLLKKYEIQREQKREATEELVIKKANRLIELQTKSKLKVKRDLDMEDEDDEPEELVKVIQPVKPKKKRTIILPPASDSEEEIVYKKEKKIVSIPKQEIQPVIKFY